MGLSSACVQVRLLPPESEAAPTCLMGDPDRLKGVLLNLYSNAAKFTREGFIGVRVRRCLANEVASETLLDPERSYRLSLQSLRRARRARAARDTGNSLSDDSGVGGLSMEAAARAAAASAADGGKPWWDRWLDAGAEPAWEDWQPCSLPPSSSPPGSGSLADQPKENNSPAGAASPLPRCDPASPRPLATPVTRVADHLHDVPRAGPCARVATVGTGRSCYRFRMHVTVTCNCGHADLCAVAQEVRRVFECRCEGGRCSGGGCDCRGCERGAADGGPRRSTHDTVRSRPPQHRVADRRPTQEHVVRELPGGTSLRREQRRRQRRCSSASLGVLRGRWRFSGRG